MNYFYKHKLRSLQKKAKVLYEKHERGERINVKQEIKTHKQLAKFYDKHLYNRNIPRAETLATEHYRTAAIAGDPESQYIFAQRQLEQGKFWEDFAAGICGRDIHKTYAESYYTEAFNYLQEAQKNGYALAKRLHGMAYINGWGLEKDEDRGFKLVVESIEDAKAWDNATKIFEELGLNKPDFFQAIMAAKQKQP